MTITAKDGTVFETVEECVKYEKELEKTHTTTTITDIYNDILAMLNLEVGTDTRNYYDGFAFRWDDFSSIDITPADAARAIISAMASFCIENQDDSCQTVEGMWKWVKEHKSFGNIITIYYTNKDSNLIRLWE